jgi:hypothetical protein
MAGLLATRVLADHFERVTESLPRARAAFMARTRGCAARRSVAR